MGVRNDEKRGSRADDVAPFNWCRNWVHRRLPCTRANSLWRLTSHDLQLCFRIHSLATLRESHAPPDEFRARSNG
ncbi:hypothetical protein PanWU01x14_171150 [Parasponia andersonii]|uniref:Uncharacterized protein n=1 Tax=Parasponia andersonii TaxID=3476 RepID=A0A2P5C9Q1_PARAD|nr:hypothetical protein PanWU01x14_171150 [Parasponia andersonii]